MNGISCIWPPESTCRKRKEEIAESFDEADLYHHHAAFTGGIYVNMHGMTRQQAAYNPYASVLTESVDTDPKLCAKERRVIMQRPGVGQWRIFGTHSMKKNDQVTGEN